VLLRATDGVDAPDLAAVALAEARRRRTRTRGALAAVGSMVSVASVVTVFAVVDSGEAPEPAPGVPTPTRTDDLGLPPLAPEIDPGKAQPVWDPEQVGSLPWDGSLGLPQDLTPVRSADLATSAVVAAADHDDLFCLLLPTGQWVNAGDYPEPAPEGVGRSLALSDDGSRIAVTGRTALWWRDIPGGKWTRVDYPAPMAGQVVQLDFADDTTLMLDRFDAFWSVDLTTGASERLPFDIFDDVSALPDGDFVASRFAVSGTAPRVVGRLHDGELLNLTNPAPLGSLQHAVGSDTTLVATRADGSYPDVEPTDHDGLLALDLDGLTTRAYLPVEDGRAYYADSAGLTATGWLDDDTVLAQVRPKSEPTTTWVITWNVETGELRRAGSYPTDARLTFAIDAL
jgi:hypothetical protein